MLKMSQLDQESVQAIYQSVEEVATIKLQAESAMHDLLHRWVTISAIQIKSVNEIAQGFAVDISKESHNHETQDMVEPVLSKMHKSQFTPLTKQDTLHAYGS